MDKKILQQLKELQKTIAVLATNMVTKEEAKFFFTKDDASKFATKDDIKTLKTEIVHIRRGLIHVRKELKNDIEEAFGQLAASTIKHKADKEDVEILEERVTKLEHKVIA